MSEQDWVKIFESKEVYQAEIIKQKLVDNGIEAVVLNKHESAFDITGEAEVHVPASLVESALELINTDEEWED